MGEQPVDIAMNLSGLEMSNFLEIVSSKTGIGITVPSTEIKKYASLPYIFKVGS